MLVVIDEKAMVLFMRCFFLIKLLVLSCLLISGCHRAATHAALERERSHFRWLSMAYMDFTRQNQGQIPKTVNEFKDFVEEYGQQYMAENQLTIDSFFLSPHDGHPYVFYTQENKSPQGVDVIGHEREGVDGKRYLADSSGGVQEIADELFNQMIP